MTPLKLIAETGLDINKKIFSINGEINDEAYEHVVNCFAMINSHVAEDPEAYAKIVPSILLSTYGGEVYYGFAIYDFIKCFEPLTEIVCCGPVMSAGMIVLQSAAKRSMTPLAHLMIHFGSQSADDSKTVEHFDKVSKLMVKVVTERVTVNKTTSKKWFKSETYFDATRAKESGLIDTIVGYQGE